MSALEKKHTNFAGKDRHFKVEVSKEHQVLDKNRQVEVSEKHMTSG